MMMEQITLEQFRGTVRIRLRLLRVFILLCAAAVFCAHFWGHRGGVPGEMCIRDRDEDAQPGRHLHRVLLVGDIYFMRHQKHILYFLFLAACALS